MGEFFALYMNIWDITIITYNYSTIHNQAFFLVCQIINEI